MQMVQIAGRLGSDPETRFTPGGQKVTSFRMATNTRRSGKDETTWWSVTIWGDRFDKMLPFLKKGSAVIVYGELRSRIYTDKAGQPQVGLEVVADVIKFNPFGGDRSGEGAGEYSGREPESSSSAKPAYGANASYQPTGTPANGRASAQEEDLDDDLPF